MAEFYLVAVVLLFVLALVDLSVGVSNDAVNFLNSAIGSRVATRRTIMIVASVGIIFGATFSAGLMEVARKGIFNPELFTFADVMVIFLAVMLADVILLDLFNTFGLPTSTTVSIVFELLGASVVVAMLVVMASPDQTSITPFINGSSALAIIAGIVLSVGVAFTVGTVVQFVSRLFFSFDRSRHGPLLIAVWSAIAMAAITDFLFVKGLKGASFVSPETAALVNANMVLTIAALFVVWLAIVLVIQRLGVQPLKLVVLAGTFALAMAFAGNDLVNFIGVPLAGMASWRAWEGSGVAPDAFTMSMLTQPVRGNTLWLLGAGAVMTVTLWLSAKARSVTDTEVSLGRQDEGAERFTPGPVSRTIVGVSRAAGRTLPRWMPETWLDRMNERFRRPDEPATTAAPAFDLIRASVNLTVAAILIAIATSLKLPLSTTYVSFMVAMGTSLADRAWGADSAVYRVSGVVNVIGGWFATALIAFSAAGLFALIIYQFELPGALTLAVLAAAALVHSHRFHARRRTGMADVRLLSLQGLTREEALGRMRERIAGQLARLRETVVTALRALETGDRTMLEPAGERLRELAEATTLAERRLVAEMKRAGLASPETGVRFLALFDAEQDLLDSSRTIVETVDMFVRNGHRSPAAEVVGAIGELQQLLAAAIDGLRTQAEAGGADPSTVLTRARERADSLVQVQLRDLEDPDRSARNGALQLTVTLECLDLIEGLERLSGRLRP